jgi:hypothetical protein
VPGVCVCICIGGSFCFLMLGSRVLGFKAKDG